uniref:Zinc transporter n=1 Tax=Aureoumbra lagunensis TaxID=44058 RepID=A0A7S3NMN3_9STRA|mmetsp:Transcript_1036/g.1289  ORF Transcript_1036/g.1289 Transcript_1036/m.1289 type:complete len:291 (+) Transcript_1036:39-911(+)
MLPVLPDFQLRRTFLSSPSSTAVFGTSADGLALTNTEINALSLSLFAGAATSLGGLVVFGMSKNEVPAALLATSLALAAGAMFSVSFLELMVPSSTSELSINWFISGCFIYGILSYLLRAFYEQQQLSFTSQDRMYRLGILMTVALTIHNFPEGLAVAMSASSSNRSSGLIVAIAIAIHNIPEGMAIAGPLLASSAYGRIQALLATALSGFSESLGAILGLILLRYNTSLASSSSNIIVEDVQAVVAGIMSSVALFELLPEAIAQEREIYAIFGFLAGWGIIGCALWLLD